MVTYKWGEIEGVSEGQIFARRTDLREAWIHRAPVAGIDGNSKVGCSSIVLNGGYVDDSDLGDEIVYTGHGGNDPNTKKQIADQNWDDPGNKALMISQLHGKPIRVTRGSKHKSEYSPEEGYRYGGIYYVTDYFEDIGTDGFRICRFRLVKADRPVRREEDEEEDNSSSEAEGHAETQRRQSTTMRIVRDTLLSKQVKEMYNFQCQVCLVRIAVRDVPYAEGAHIKPLGNPHNGEDKIDNLLCLCPNHHVMLDKGAFTIEKDYSLTGLTEKCPDKLSVHKDHEINSDNLNYHMGRIFIND